MNQKEKIIYFLITSCFIVYVLLDKRYRSSAKPFTKTFFIDKEGNEIQVFSEETPFPKPGGGYCNMTAIKDKEEYFRALETPTAHCKHLEHFQGYHVCIDDFKKQKNCVVLDFGIENKWGFSDSLIDKFDCKAYAFDPTMQKKDHMRKNGKCHFLNLGLSSFKGTKTMQFMNGIKHKCKVYRYVDIVSMLGLSTNRIDFLKLDIEGSELDFFLDTASNHPELLENVEQILIELHNLEKLAPWHTGNHIDTTQFDMMKIVDILHCHGFALAHTHMPIFTDHNSWHNFMYNGKKRGANYVTTWIRI